VIWILFLTVLWLIIWASFAEIDEITRGQGKVIPSNEIQIVQNLEGGIISEILIKKGDHVKQGQILVRIDATGFRSKFQSSTIRINELKAKALRLNAEANAKEFKLRESMNKYEKQAYALYLLDLEQLENEKAILKSQLIQKKGDLDEARENLAEAKRAYDFIVREININEPLVKKGLVSEVEFLKLQREQNTLKSDMKSAEITIPRLEAAIREVKAKMKEADLRFRKNAKKELNEVNAEISRIGQSQSAIEDQVDRTAVRAPVSGTVKQIFTNTIGGIVKPGMDIVEIVPADDKLLIEARIKPADIAFLYPGLRAIVKFTAYDFASYGGLEGTLTFISADTIIKDNEEAYLVNIETDQSFLKGKNGENLKIIPGMTVSVDIITGKKTVLSYLLKPMLKLQNNAFTEK
jgi:adhesin transport system membrane fusion protein